MRRVPYVTFTLIAINLLVCVFTSWITDPSDQKLALFRHEILGLNAYYPEVHGSPAAEALIREARRTNPAWFDSYVHSDGNFGNDMPRSVMRVRSGQLSAQEAMDRLSGALEQAQRESFYWKYAFHSYRPTPQSSITASFIHQGAIHLLGNMWFLYLGGAILEATWGYWFFGAFYLAGGAVAFLGQAVARPDSPMLVVGASGAVAACLGAFLVRFPKVRVKLVWILYIWFRGGTFQFSIPAFYVLPLWVAFELAYGFLSLDSVAHWAHVTGFVFGAAVAFLVSKSGLEEFLNREDESLTWRPDNEILHATQFLQEKKYDEAEAVLHDYLRRKPDSIDGLETLLQVQRSAEHKLGETETLGALCRLALRSGRFPEAWQRYGEWIDAEGGPLAAAEWMQLCRYLEREKNYPRTVQECQRLVQTYPAEPQSVDAMLLMARICLEKLKDTEEAEKWFLAARESVMARPEFEGAILEGLKACARRSAQTTGK